MFKKFDFKENVSGQSLAKSSVQRAIRQQILQQYPPLAPVLDEFLMPKKSPLLILKCHDHVQMITIDGRILFFNAFDGPWYPTLQVLHQFPNMMPQVQVDKGAIKFILSGANIMCPGLTSPGAKMEVDLPKDSIVAVMAEGKEHALAVGKLMLSTNEIRTLNKGPGVETVHYLQDALWTHPRMDG